MQFQGRTRRVRRRGIPLAAILAASAFAATPASAAVDPGVIGQWRFDEPAGQTALDDGPSGLHGQLGATAGSDDADPERIPGLLGGALRFDGDAYVSLPDAPELAPRTLTIEAVVRAAATPGAYRYVASRGSRACFSGTYGLYTAKAGGIAFYIFDGERYFVSSTARVEDIWDGDWHRVTGVFDGAAVRVFVDGTQIGDALLLPPDTAIGYDQGEEPTYFGTYVGTCTLPFVGDLDSVRIWSLGQSVARVAVEAGPPTATPGPPVPAAATVPDPLPAGDEPVVIASDAPPRSSCTVKVSRKTITVRNRAVVTVRAARGGRPLTRAHVAVRRAGQPRILASRRTNAKGRARIALKIAKVGRLRVSIGGNSSCSPAYIRVAARA